MKLHRDDITITTVLGIPAAHLEIKSLCYMKHVCNNKYMHDESEIAQIITVRV